MKVKILFKKSKTVFEKGQSKCPNADKQFKL